MADPDLQGTASSNKTTNKALNFLGTSKNEPSVSPLPSAWSWSLGHPTCFSSSNFPTCLTVERETLFEESHQNVSPPKYKRDTRMECGSTIDLDRLSLRLANTEGEDEDMDTDDTSKRDIGELEASRQKQTVTGIDKLEEKRAVDISDGKSGDDISEVQPLRLFNFPPREIATTPHNSSLAINQSGEPSANTSSILPRSVQRLSSPCTIDYPLSLVGGEQHTNTECASFKPLANGHSAFKPRSISTGKPPLPPGAATHLKGGVAAKAHKIHFLNRPQDLRKRVRLSEFASEKIVSVAESDNEGCGKRGNSNPPYGRSDRASKRLATKCGNSDKVTSSDTNSSMAMVTLSEYILAGQPESSVQANSFPEQEFLVFGNYNVKKSLCNQIIGKDNSKNASTLDPKTKLFQLSKCCVTGKVHHQSFFEDEQNKHIQELTIGQSSCSNNGATLQVSSGSLLNASGLLSTTFSPISRGQETYRSLATSLGDNMPGNMAKYSSPNFSHFKAWKADIKQCYGEPNSHVTSTTDKSKMTISMRQSGSPPCSLENIDRMQLQASRTSFTDSLSCEAIVAHNYKSCEAIVAHNYKAKAEHRPHIDRDEMNTMEIDYQSHNKTHLKGPVNLSQTERSRALQVSSKSTIKQLHYNVSESAKGSRYRSGSCSISAESGKVDCDRIQRQPNQVNVGVCNWDSQCEGTVLGASSEVALISCERDPSNSKTEHEHPDNIIASRDSLVVLEHQMDANFCSSQECCVDITQKSWSKRFKKTTHCVEKMQEPSFSEMVGTHQQSRQILDGPQGSKDPEAVRLPCRLEIAKTSQEVSGCERLCAYKDVHEQHHGSLHVPYPGDNMTSCLQKYPRHIDHQASSSVVDLNFTSFGENTMGTALHSLESKALQRKVGSTMSQRKIDAASVLSHPWIQRWRSSYQIEPALCEMHCGSLTNKKYKSLPHPFAPMKMMPSAAAMAIVGIAARQFPPCHLQKKGSFSVWTAVGFSMNRTTPSQ